MSHGSFAFEVLIEFFIFILWCLNSEMWITVEVADPVLNWFFDNWYLLFLFFFFQYIGNVSQKLFSLLPCGGLGVSRCFVVSFERGQHMTNVLIHRFHSTVLLTIQSHKRLINLKRNFWTLSYYFQRHE